MGIPVPPTLHSLILKVRCLISPPFLFNRGHTYVFTSVSVSSSHPFMIGESYGDMESSLVVGDPLTGTGGKITVSIPSDFDGSLHYFCTSHTSMLQEFSILTEPSSTFTVSGGQPSYPYYQFTDGNGQGINFSTFNLTRGWILRIYRNGHIYLGTLL